MNNKDTTICYELRENNEVIHTSLDVDYSSTDMFADIDNQIKKKVATNNINIEYHQLVFNESTRV